MMQNDKRRPFSWTAWLLPNATVFFASACIMTLELTAGRLIARHVGVSLYTWTAIIGVVMAGIALGNFLGGRIADRTRPRGALALLFFAAALSCVGILPLNRLAGEMQYLAALSWPSRIFWHVAITFGVPAILLGTMTPVVAKMALDYKRSAGRTVGGVFAWGVAGSLVGTFFTGFYLVMHLGATAIVLCVAFGLAGLGVLYTLLFFLERARREEASANIAPPERHAAIPVQSLLETASIWAPAAITVFLSNMAFMVFELAALRVIAREFGSSLYTWTTVIGVVLGGISLGNYLGGRLADRSGSSRRIAAVFSCAAIAVMVSPLCGSLASDSRYYFVMYAEASWIMQIVVYTLALCFVPCVFIGMVSPLVTRRLLARGRTPGAAVGAVYAWGAIGAIFGTFLAGYFLIQWLGSLPVIALTALVLALVAPFYANRKWLAVAPVALCALLLAGALTPTAPLERIGTTMRLRVSLSPDTVYEDESQYTHIRVEKIRDEPMGRAMLLDQLIHTKTDITDPTVLLYEYEWVYAGITEMHRPAPTPINAFVIGGGGYSFPNYLVHTRPGSHVVVAEIDAAVTEAAHAAMGLPRDTEIEIHNRDGRIVAVDLLRRQTDSGEGGTFDVIYGDSINNYTVPYHLTTLEFKRMVYDLLADDGVYMLNMIDILNEGGFLAAVINTCREVFPHVSVLNSGASFATRDTFIVVCSKTPMPLQNIPRLIGADYSYRGAFLSDVVINGLLERHETLVLTDDFAPVENLVAPVVQTSEGDKYSVNLHHATRHAERGNIERAIEHCRRALEMEPHCVETLELLADLHLKQDDAAAALDALKKAAEYHPEPADLWYSVGRIALDAGKPDETLIALNRCVYFQPDHVAAWYNMGVLHGMRNEMAEAVNAWQQVLKHEPDHEDSLYNLAAVFIMQGDGAAAAEVLEAMREQDISIDARLKEGMQGLESVSPPGL